LLGELPTFHLASTLADGAPVLRTFHGVVVGDWLAFHAAPKGEKAGVIGRPAVVIAEETIATVPSTFFHPDKACPATTYYRSVQLHGVIEELTEPAERAAALQALMEKLQPEGGHIPITHDHPYYQAPVAGLLIAGVRIDSDHLTGKAKLAQNRRPEEITELLTSLWQRGAAGDTRAIELIREANPGAPLPTFLAAPAGLTLHAWLPDGDAIAAADMLVDEYWNAGTFTHAELVAAHRGSPAWVGARDEHGALVASARAISDGAKLAWIYDVIVAPAWRGRRVGEAVTRLLLDHPQLRSVRRVMLGTRDAMPLYERFGFVDRETLPPRSFTSVDMIRIRP
jgi:nitroimidazol reductase NimA-like FMN-containing flavoprotein (pyridoxamine 5'-phosphate oxidase superfamily)/GNAT superfamily N-acetyltransferase